MRITLNGEATEITSQNLTEALAELGYTGATVATAVNGEFVAGDLRATVNLGPGDTLEVLAPMQGG